MPTINQLVKNARKPQRKRSKAKALEKSPFKSGIVLRTGVMKPKKPNSAHRHFARVRLSTGREVTCHVPGEGHNLQEHASVLVRGGGVPDLPGVSYRIVRGNRDCNGVQPSKKWANGGEPVARNKGRSRYGVPSKK